jgi:hypothetical protein
MVMRKKTLPSMCLFALAGLTAGLAAPAAAQAKSIGSLASFHGVTVRGSPFHYAAVSNDRFTAAGRQVPGRWTVVVRTAREGGRLTRWWQLRGSYDVPAVSYDVSGGGALSGDGSTLVLSRLSPTYPTRVSRFAVLDTGARSGRLSRSSRPVRHIALRGDFSLHAISRDGSIAYLVHRLPRYRGPAYISNHELRTLNTASGRLAPRPIDEPGLSEAALEGLPVSRAASPDGRWAYTLYDGGLQSDEAGGVPFIRVLDTLRGRSVRVPLPQLDKRPSIFSLRLRTERSGRELTIVPRPPAPNVLNKGDREPLLTLNTESLEVVAPDPGGDPPWGAIAAAALALVLAVVWSGSRRRRVGRRHAPA